jgi:multidrug efflux pump subunit AcrA (membrane-fusion protein)
MMIRSILSSYFRLLTGALLALSVIALSGCQESTAEKVVPGRPVLVATVKYEASSPERSFVGTIKPRIETDMGFRVPGKVAKRLVEVGQTVDIGQPLALLDEVDLKLQAEQAQAEFSAATGVLAQASASEQRAKDLRTKGWNTDAQMDSARAAGAAKSNATPRAIAIRDPGRPLVMGSPSVVPGALPPESDVSRPSTSTAVKVFSSGRRLRHGVCPSPDHLVQATDPGPLV